MRTTVFTRRRHSRAAAALTAVAVLIVLALAVAVAEHLAEVLILLTVVGAVALFRRNRRASSRAATEAAAARPAVTLADGTPAADVQHGSMLDTRARRNGWVPPRAPRVMSGVSAACAEGDCISCPGAPCACLCRHESARIVAINGGLADLAGGGDGQTSIPGALR